MRILHTSDWHLGRSFAEHRMLDGQALMLDWMLDVVRSEGIELVVVAGDLFDRSLPPADAWELLWDTFRRLVGAGAVVVAVAGNHDSPERLGATLGLTELAGVHVRGGHRQSIHPVVIDLPSGSLAVAPVPFLDPRLLPVEGSGPESGEDAEMPPHVVNTHESVLADALRRSLSSMPASTPRLAVAHAFVTGASPSGSERELAVGEATMVSASLFDGFDYVALGHLHSPQEVAGRADLRYSGSPLAYSFAEKAQKEVVLVELLVGQPARSERLAVGVGRGVRTVRGTIDELLSLPPDDANWVRAELTDHERPVDPARRLRDNFAWLAEVEWTGARSLLDGLDAPAGASPRATSMELAEDYWMACTGGPPGPAERVVLADVLESSEESEGAAA
jgi:exonuclease SbcD